MLDEENAPDETRNGGPKKIIIDKEMENEMVGCLKRPKCATHLKHNALAPGMTWL